MEVYIYSIFIYIYIFYIHIYIYIDISTCIRWWLFSPSIKGRCFDMKRLGRTHLRLLYSYRTVNNIAGSTSYSKWKHIYKWTNGGISSCANYVKTTKRILFCPQLVQVSRPDGGNRKTSQVAIFIFKSPSSIVTTGWIKKSNIARVLPLYKYPSFFDPFCFRCIHIHMYCVDI